LIPKSQNVVRSHKVIEAFANIIRPIPGNYRPDNLLASGLLQDIFGIFSAHQGVLGSVREVFSIPSKTKNRLEGQELRFFAFHAAGSSEPRDRASSPPEIRHFPLRSRETSNAWLCLDEWKVVTFDRPKCGDYFKPTHKLSEQVKSGVCIPLITWTHGKPVQWVLSLDFLKTMAWKSADIEFLLYATRKLSAILSDNTPVFYESPDEFFKNFPGVAMQGTDISWINLYLKSKGSRRSEAVPIGGKGERLLGEWKPVKGPTGLDYGVEETLGGHAYRVPLRCGPFDVGNCTFGTTAKSSFDRDSEVGTILGAWSNFSGMLGGATQYWEARFKSRAFPKQPGIKIWDEEVFWSPPPDFAGPITCGLRQETEHVAE
jgi:hypothetical protein